MKITVERIASNDDATISTIYVDGVFQCFGLEDEYREIKVASETRIPAGLYPVGVRTVGGFHARYSRKFGSAHRGMLEIKNVPNFTDILIHIGNTEKDTAGCLLVGTGAMAGDDLTILASTPAYKRLYGKVIAAAEDGNLSIQIIDRC